MSNITYIQAQKLIKDIKEWLNQEESFYINSFFINHNYPPSIINTIIEKYPNLEEKINNIKKIDEAKIAKLMMSGKLNQTSAMFVLKNCYGWTDAKNKKSNDTKNTLKIEY